MRRQHPVKAQASPGLEDMASGIGSPSPCSGGSDDDEMEILLNNAMPQHPGMESLHVKWG